MLLVVFFTSTKSNLLTHLKVFFCVVCFLVDNFFSVACGTLEMVWLTLCCVSWTKLWTYVPNLFSNPYSFLRTLGQWTLVFRIIAHPIPVYQTKAHYKLSRHEHLAHNPKRLTLKKQNKIVCVCVCVCVCVRLCLFLLFHLLGFVTMGGELMQGQPHFLGAVVLWAILR